MKKLIALMLCMIFLIPSWGCAEGATSWLYSFSAGEMLAGEGVDKVREFLDAVQVQLSTERRGTDSLGESVLISYGKPVFTLRAAASGEEELGLYCSLMGECTLLCRQDQVENFLLTLVQMLSDLRILKDSSLAQAQSLARRAGELVLMVVRMQENVDPSFLLDLNFYLKQADHLSSETERETLDPANGECPGAAEKRTWQLTEEELNALVNMGIAKVKRVPILSDAFVEGRLRIGVQPVTEGFLRELVSALHGNTTLTVYTDAAGDVICMRLYTPDISQIMEDPLLAGMQGVEFYISETDDARQISETSINLIGVEGSLLRMRTEKSEGNSIQDLPAKKTYQVGEMNSTELWDLIRSLGLTIAANAINLVMDLPRVVFDTLVDKIF